MSILLYVDVLYKYDYRHDRLQNVVSVWCRVRVYAVQLTITNELTK